MIGPDAVQHDVEGQQFRLAVEGELAVLEYRQQGGVMVIAHTGVPVAIGGRGIAAELMRAALAHAREQGWKVDPACSYAAAFFERHRQEYADLLV